MIRAAHPIPDERSVAAAEALMGVARDAPLLLALISGGASSLACAPVASVSLAEKQALVEALLRSGAPIVELNRVRRHLSRFKGGGLAAVAQRTLAVVVSDVIDGEASDIGSGPASEAPRDLELAREALRRYAPTFAHLADVMIESPVVNASAQLVARPEDLGERAAEIARERGYQVTLLPPTLADADEIARVLGVILDSSSSRSKRQSRRSCSAHGTGTACAARMFPFGSW